MASTLNRRQFLASSSALALSALAGCATNPRTATSESSAQLPNVVIIYTDDQGYSDLACFGAPDIKTPNIDRLAQQGRRFSDFYVAQPICSASRAGLLTGCYPNRIGILGALGPRSRHGLSDNEMTIAQLLKQKSYATAIFGKWHLGDAPQFLPTRHGFDEYFGLPYSNDMWPNHPTNGKAYPPLPLIEGEKVVELMPDQTQLTTWYTQRAVSFIERNKARPFFLYLAHNMPHVPLFVSDKFKGKSAAGLYGDVIQEIDWSVGQVLEALRKNGLEENTLVIFASDNGPWLSYGEHAGHAVPLREGKATVWDGGTRVPCLMRLPGRIPANTLCTQPAMTIDILPTLAHLTGATLPDHRIDGLNIWPLIAGQSGARCPHDAYYFYMGDQLQALRSENWKLHFPHGYNTLGGKPGGTGGRPAPYQQAKTELALFDLEKDTSETTNLADRHPEVVQRLQTLAEAAREDLGDSRLGRKGNGVRQPGRLVRQS